MTSNIDLGDSWKDAGIPAEQARRCTDTELSNLHKGNPPEVYEMVVEALEAIPGSNKLTLLEIGCATGYYYEAIATLVGDRFQYIGSDYSDAMLVAARKRYPDVTFLNLDIRHIKLPGRAYDVVLSGAVLMHIQDWREAVRELARITASYLILHRTPVTDGETSIAEGKIYAGIPVYVNTFNQVELLGLLAECGFRKVFERSGIPDYHMTYVFERLPHH